MPSEASQDRSMKSDLVWRVLAILFFLLLFSISPPQFAVSKPFPHGFGAAIGYGLGGTEELNKLGDVWYVDYGYGGDVLGGHRRLFLVEAGINWDSAYAVALAHRGEWWQFGNEPNDPNQDNLSPSEFAQRYHEFYLGLKKMDPRASVVVGGIADADWKWADAFRENYREAFTVYPTVDGWSIHNYLLDRCEDATDVPKFASRIMAFRDWMTRIGAMDLPLLLTEYGVLYGNGCCSCPAIDPDEVVGFMRSATLWMARSNMVQGWAWFAVRSGGRFNGDLVSDRGDLSLYGSTYRDLYDNFHPPP
jgi:putative glycosyl hydrolase